MIYAIDPGTTQSAYVVMDRHGTIDWAGIETNDEVITRIRRQAVSCKVAHWQSEPWHLAIEMIASYGMPVGREVFETCVWIGRFIEAWNESGYLSSLIYRKDVKMHLCGTPRAKDANIRQALIDLYGGKDKAIGKKKAPGPLYGFKKDMWAALGVGVTYIARGSE